MITQTEKDELRRRIFRAISAEIEVRAVETSEAKRDAVKAASSALEHLMKYLDEIS